MSVISHHMMEDPTTWQPSNKVVDAKSAFEWLLKHLARYDKLLYTAKKLNPTYGFQPFTFSKDGIMKCTWIRQFTAHDKFIIRTSRSFPALGGAREFITWIIPEYGCLTILINQRQPYKLLYLSKEALVRNGTNADAVFREHAAMLSAAKNYEDAVSVMTQSAMIYS